MFSRTAMVLALVLAAMGCKDDPGSERDIEEMKARKGKPQPAAPKDNIRIITSPVPYGKKLSCTTLLEAAPDTTPGSTGALVSAKMSAAVGQPLTVKEILGEDAEAAAVCAVHTTGKPLTEKEQKKKFDTEGMRLGVLPGDELCRVSAYCWGAPEEVAAMKKDCEEKGMQTSTEIGDLTCVKVFEAGADYRFVYRVSDSDTKCILQINPGPSVNSASDSIADEKVVKGCAKAFADTIGPENIKVTP
jgi:hypothetical protein